MMNNFAQHVYFDIFKVYVLKLQKINIPYKYRSKKGVPGQQSLQQNVDKL